MEGMYYPNSGHIETVKEFAKAYVRLYLKQQEVVSKF